MKQRNKEHSNVRDIIEGKVNKEIEKDRVRRRIIK